MNQSPNRPTYTQEIDFFRKNQPLLKEGSGRKEVQYGEIVFCSLRTNSKCKSCSYIDFCTGVS